MTRPSPGRVVSWAVGPSVFTSAVWADAPDDVWTGEPAVWVAAIRGKGFTRVPLAAILPAPEPETLELPLSEVHDGPE